MSKSTTGDFFPDYTLFKNELAIRNEYSRFACMFYLFTILAVFMSVILFLFANNFYYEEIEEIQRRFIPYFVLGLISFILFLIFFLGSIVYTMKFLQTFQAKSLPTSPQIVPRSNKTHNQIQRKSSSTDQLFITNTEESYSTHAKTMMNDKYRTKSNLPCQTDV